MFAGAAGERRSLRTVLDQEGRSFYRVGGIAALVVGAA
jgi:hypothetical protein